MAPTIPPRRPWRRPLAAGLVAAAIQAALIALTAGARLRKGTEDTDLYFRYASRMLGGEVPYRDFPIEYPPLALPFFLAPAAVVRDLVGFKVAFAAEMLALNALIVLLVAVRVAQREGTGRIPARLAWYTLIVLILSRLIVTRYDSAPTLAAIAATLAWAAGRPALGGLAGGLGTLIKVYPAAPSLVALVADWRHPAGRRGRGAVMFALVVLGGGLAWVGLGGVRGAAGSLRYQGERGLEYGSLYSGAQMLVAKVLGASIAIERDHAAFSSVTRWSKGLLGLVFPIQAAAIVGVCWVFARRGARELIRYSAAAVLAFIATGKVFSPQFLIWLIPFMAVLDGPRAGRLRWLFAATCAATLLAPAGLGWLDRTDLAIILAYNGRNALLIWLLFALVFGPASTRRDDEATVAADPESEQRDVGLPEPRATGKMGGARTDPTEEPS